MAKSLDDLGGMDARVESDLAAQRREVEKFIQRCQDMEDDGTLQWAYYTISDIREHVERTQRVTQGQIDALNNIQRAADAREPRRRGGSRRYEGWK